jgi:hypothetical protein
MLADDRPQISLECHGHAVTAVNADKAAAVGVEEVDFGMPAGLTNLVYLEAGRAKRTDGVTERRAH